MFKLVRHRSATTYQLHGPCHDSFTVGRGPDSTLCIDDRLISAQHARFEIKGSRLLVMDLDSRNGTEVNGQRLKPLKPHRLRTGDVVDFAGRLSFRVDAIRADALPVIQIEADATADLGDGIIRRHRLPEPDAALPNALRLNALLSLTQELLDPDLRQNRVYWLDHALSRLATLLNAPRACAYKHSAEAFIPIYPTDAPTPRGSILTILNQNPASIGLEMLAPPNHTDLRPDPHATPAVGMQVESALISPIRNTKGQLWGMLYVTQSIVGRRYKFNVHDLWLLDRAAQLWAPLILATPVVASLDVL